MRFFHLPRTSVSQPLVSQPNDGIPHSRAS
jgi:hypothetical protein